MHPKPGRLPIDPTIRAAAMAAHDEAVDAGRGGYIDPSSSLFVMTARTLADRGYCCDNGCRHCPYE